MIRSLKQLADAPSWLKLESVHPDLAQQNNVSPTTGFILIEDIDNLIDKLVKFKLTGRTDD